MTKHWKGPIDLEKKYKLEQGTIWNWTDLTLPFTAPEKFLDIFLLLAFFNFFIFMFFITPLIFTDITYYYYYGDWNAKLEVKKHLE